MLEKHGNLEILIEAEIAAILVLLFRLIVFLVGASHDTRLLVIADALLEEVGLARERDGFHEVERIGRMVELLVAQRQ